MSWSVDDVMPGRGGPENLSILKKKVESWDWIMETESWVSVFGAGLGFDLDR